MSGNAGLLNIVIPMAGLGSRFSNAGYQDPKPFIKIHGIEMIRWVIKNLTPKGKHRFIFICQNEHISKYKLDTQLGEWAPGSIVIGLDGVTSGAAETVLSARDFIDSNEPLLIANSDQWVEADIDLFLQQIWDKKVDGMIMTMTSSDSKWSFAEVDKNSLVKKVVEKQVISDIATVGLYGFAKGKDFINAADRMIREDFRVNNEFYVAPVYNWLIKTGARVSIFPIGTDGNGMHGLGIPEDLVSFENHPVSKSVW
jgi:NDP-sugar pyrophosphorylase family protein